MNKAKVVYYDKDGNMVKSTRYKNKRDLVKVKVEPNTIVHKKSLKLVKISWLNHGITLWFEDENGKIYPMTDMILYDYLEKNSIDLGERDIEFFQQGYVYSIGLVDKEEDSNA